MDSLIRDLRIGLRSLRRQPGFFAVAVITLALGIGASTAIFAVVEASMLRRLPFDQPDRLAMVWGVAGPERSVRGASPIEVADWGTLTHSFTDISVFDQVMMNLSGDGDAAQVPAERISGSYFSMLGASPALGRAIGREDERVGAPPVAVISDNLWRTRYGADADILGRAIDLDAQRFTIIGVMPRGFAGISFTADVWTTLTPFLSPEAMTVRGNRWLGAVARLNDGATKESAQADLDNVARRLAEQFAENVDRGAQLIPLRQAALGNVRGILMILLSGVALLLLIACANVANLQLVRGNARGLELSLRHALGASRTRIARQLVTESLLISTIGAGAGILTASFALAALLPLIPTGLLPGYATVSLNPAAVLFACGIALVAGAVLGIAPSLRATTVSPASLTGTRASGGGWRRGRVSLQQLIVGGEIALSLMLLGAAGLAVRSLRAQLAIEPGFEANGVLAASVNLTGDRYDRPGRALYAQQLLDELRAIPGVTAAAIASDVPLRGTGSSASRLKREGFPDDAIRFYRHSVTTDYFETLRIPLIAGRLFTEADRADGPGLVVVSEAFAKRLWPGQDAVGKRIVLGQELVPVIGVVGDVHYRDLTTSLMDPTNDPDLYFAHAQLSSSGPTDILVRTNGDPGAVTAGVREAVRRMDPTRALFNIADMETTLRTQTGLGRLASSLLALFAVLSLVLAAVGLYGVMAFVVRGRQREIAIRSAIGAAPRDIRKLIMGQSFAVVTTGLAIGLAGAIAAGRILAGLLYGISAFDPLVLSLTAGALLGAALIASWLPARTAMKVAPRSAMAAE